MECKHRDRLFEEYADEVERLSDSANALHKAKGQKRQEALEVNEVAQEACVHAKGIWRMHRDEHGC
jgi:hypothetical protein